jgi:hypothetical protein
MHDHSLLEGDARIGQVHLAARVAPDADEIGIDRLLGGRARAGLDDDEELQAATSR